MQAKVTSKSPYGFKVEGNPDWINYGKFYEGNKDFKVGDTVEYETKGKFLKTLDVIVTSLVLDNLTSGVTTPTITQTLTEVTKKYNGYQKSPEVQAQINRSSALKSASTLASAAFAVAFQNGEHAEVSATVKQIAIEFERYINTGSFDNADLLSEVTSD